VDVRINVFCSRGLVESSSATLVGSQKKIKLKPKKREKIRRDRMNEKRDKKVKEVKEKQGQLSCRFFNG
jgi:hypothetical protein